MSSYNSEGRSCNEISSQSDTTQMKPILLTYKCNSWHMVTLLLLAVIFTSQHCFAHLSLAVPLDMVLMFKNKVVLMLPSFMSLRVTSSEWSGSDLDLGLREADNNKLRQTFRIKNFRYLNMLCLQIQHIQHLFIYFSSQQSYTRQQTKQKHMHSNLLILTQISLQLQVRKMYLGWNTVKLHKNE